MAPIRRIEVRRLRMPLVKPYRLSYRTFEEFEPFVVLVVYAQMADFDAGILESARDLGASRFTVFKTIILPMIRPVIIGATLIAMSVSLDDFIITFFTIGGGLTLPTMIWGMLRTSLDPSVNALGSLVLAATMGASMVALRLTNYRG